MLKQGRYDTRIEERTDQPQTKRNITALRSKEHQYDPSLPITVI